jgi:hypothetical protein
MKKKGVKARKKRLAGGGGGGGSAGTYPMSVDNAGPSADNAFGIMSIDHGSATTQSGLTHGSLSISSIIDMNVDPEDPSAMIAPFTGPTIQIADYVATVIQSQTPINDASGSQMIAGELVIPNIVGNNKQFRISLDVAVYNPDSEAFGGGSAFQMQLVTDTLDLVNQGAVQIHEQTPSVGSSVTVHSGTISSSFLRGSATIDFDGNGIEEAMLSNQLIVAFHATDIPSKRGSGNHSTTLIQGAIGSATYVGSTYLSIKVT